MNSANAATATHNGSLATQVVRAIRWRLPLILLIALPMSSAGLWELGRQPDIYEAVAVHSVVPRPGEIASSDLLRLSAQRHAVRMGSGVTLGRVAERTGLSVADLRSQVDISVPSETANIRIGVRMSSAQEAARVANMLGVAGQPGDTQDPLVVVQFTSAAVVPEQPTSPPRELISALILLVALGSGLVVATALERLRPRLRTEADVEAIASAPVLGYLPRSPVPAGSLTGALDDERIGAAARSLRTRFLAQHSAETAPRSVAVTSMESWSAHTTVSTLLGLALARGGLRTALVYADRAITTRWFLQRLELDSEDLPEMLVGDAPAGLTCRRLLGGRLLVLSPPLGEVASDRLTAVLPKLLSDAGQIADLVLVDAPPLLDDVAGSAVITQVDAVVLVVTRGSSAKACRLALAHLADLRVPLVGTVIDDGRRLRGRRSRRIAAVTRAVAARDGEPPDD